MFSWISRQLKRLHRWANRPNYGGDDYYSGDATLRDSDGGGGGGD
jgi:hypothetical protein